MKSGYFFLCFSGCFFFFLHGHGFNSVNDARLRAWSRRLTAELPHLVPPAPPLPTCRPPDITPSASAVWNSVHGPSVVFCANARNSLTCSYFCSSTCKSQHRLPAWINWHVDTTMVCTYQVTVCIHLNFVSFFQFTRLSVKSIKCFVFLFLVLHFTKINHFDLVILINSGSFCWHFYLTSLFCFLNRKRGWGKAKIFKITCLFFF